MMGKIKQGAVVWAATGVLLLAWLGFAAGVNAGVSDEVREEVTQYEKEAHFYRVVAGVGGEAPGPANRLARDLRGLDAEELARFTGDSNRYGGITDELGFDPFNGVDCSECGPLDEEVIDNTQAVQNGDLEEVLERLESEVPTPDKMPGPPGFLWFLWVITAPATVGTLYIMQRRSEESKYREFTGERAIVHTLREAARELPDAERWRAAHIADQLEAQIETRVQYKRSKAQEMKLNHLMEEAANCLEAIAAGNKELN